MSPEQQTELDKWIGEQNSALNDAEAALRRCRFAEQMMDRILNEAGVVLPGRPERHLYSV